MFSSSWYHVFHSVQMPVNWGLVHRDFSNIEAIGVDKAPQAIHVLDRFHIMAYLSKAIDEVRAGEARQMKSDGFESVLTNRAGCC